jgi:hypothetical protein
MIKLHDEFPDYGGIPISVIVPKPIGFKNLAQISITENLSIRV